VETKWPGNLYVSERREGWGYCGAAGACELEMKWKFCRSNRSHATDNSFFNNFQQSIIFPFVTKEIKLGTSVVVSAMSC
jgi:hypothetical protein